MMKTLGIIGCGWLGERFVKLMKADYLITITTTTAAKANRYAAEGIRAVQVDFDHRHLDGTTALWSGENIPDALIITVPFSARYHSVSQLNNRMKQLVRFIGEYEGPLFFMSSTGVYADFSDEVTEADLPVAQVLSERLIKTNYPQVTILRLGGLMGDDRYLGRYNLSNLNQHVNHVHYVDVCQIITAMITAQLSGEVFNLVAPKHPTKAEIITAQTHKQIEEYGLPEGKLVSGEKLEKALNYQFQYPDPCQFQFIPVE